MRSTATCGRNRRSWTIPTCCVRHWSSQAWTPTRILALVQQQDVKDELLANTQRSVERGTFGSPTFFVGDEIYFGKDRLRDVEEAIAAGDA